jgi:hypothetical protein
VWQVFIKIPTLFSIFLWDASVSFSISEPYDFTLSLLGKMRLELSDNPSLHADANWWSTKWCLIMNHLRTFYQGQAAASTAGAF